VQLALRHLPFEKRHSFLSFPYVCPEPVLVKCSFLYINGTKSGVFRTVDPHAAMALSPANTRTRSSVLDENHESVKIN
jgi:hypothetical protein